jgi:uridine monophosphate synthetase
LTSFFSDLETRIHAIDSLLCVGLDPHEQDLGEVNGQTIRDYCFRLIELTAEVAAAYKPNAAFFEAIGGEGVNALGDIIDQVPEGIPVILDVKRGDISSTAKAYAKAAFEVLKADAVTINPYLGKDAVLPFIEDPTKGAFILCKTSNPGAKELQDLWVSGGEPSLPSTEIRVSLYEWIAELVKEWNVHGNLGLVVGATQVDSLARVRQIDPGIWILTPGIGAQGGDLQSTLKAGLREDGLGLLIPVSRSIARADNPREEAQRLRDVINGERSTLKKSKKTLKPTFLSSQQKSIADRLLEIGCIQFGEFTLKSGKISPIYFDLRKIIAHPDFLVQIAKAYYSLLKPLDFDHLAGLPYAGLPITSAISLLGNWSMVYPRKEEKSYGTKALVEGIFSQGDTAVVIDDLITTGESKLEGIEKLLENGMIVNDIVVLIDRSKNAKDFLKEQGYRLHAFLSISELLTYYQDTNQINKEVVADVNQFLEGEG